MANPNIAAEQLLELLLTLKKTTPAAAKGILNSQPAIAYALITLMVSMNAINIEVFQKTLAEFGASSAAESSSSTSNASQINNMVPQNLPPPAAPAPISAIPPHLQTQYRTSTPPSSSAPQHTPTPPYGYASSNGQASSSTPHAPTPPAQGGYGGYPQQGYGQHGYGYQQQQQQQQPPQSTYPQQGYQQLSSYQQQQQQQQQYPSGPQQGGYGGYPPYGQHPPSHSQGPPPPAAQTPTPGLQDALANIPDEQKALIMRVLAMTPEQINMLPPADRATYIQIRSTLGVST